MLRPPAEHPVSIFCDSYGILLRRDAVLAGIDDNALRRLVATKALVRLRQGAYCLRATYRAADEAERHRLLCRAVVRQYGAQVALSHASSCLLQGGPSYGLRLADAHLTHFDGLGRRQSRVVHHQGQCNALDVRRQQGSWVTVPARAVLEVACVDGLEAGLVQANHFLHTGAISPEELRERAARTSRWPGSLNHHALLLLADPRIASVGETRTDFLIWMMQLPRPVPQYEVRHPDGTVAARVDFAWPGLKVVVEFDGREKYHRYRREGETIAQMVEREKRREDLIRELTGWTVVRLVWSDLDVPQHTAGRIRRAMRMTSAAA